jgi:hypothetical protein
MFFEKNLYLAVSEISCFDNEGDTGAGDTGAGDTGAADPGAADPGAADPDDKKPTEKMHTTDAVNKIVEERLARDRKSREAVHKDAFTKLESSYNELLEVKGLSDEGRAKVESQLEEVKNQLRTKEERAKHEKDKLQTSFEKQLTEERAGREMWEQRFRDSSIQRSLQDAAVSNDAYNADQVMRLLRPLTSLKPVLDDAGKETGQFRAIIDFPDHDETGNEVTFSGNPDEIVKRMRDLKSYANLFTPNVVAGLGANNATGGIHTGSNGQIDASTLSTAQYRKIRAETPELLGLKAKD